MALTYGKAWVRLASNASPTNVTRDFMVWTGRFDQQWVTHTERPTDWVAGSEVILNWQHFAQGLQPAVAPNIVQIQLFADDTGSLIRTIQLDSPAPNTSGTVSFWLTHDGTSTGSPRSGTYRLRVRMVNTNDALAANRYDVYSDVMGGSGTNAPPTGHSIGAADWGQLRGMTTSITTLGRLADGTPLAPGEKFAYGDTIYARNVLGHAPLLSRQVTVQLGSRAAVLLPGNATTTRIGSLGVVDDSFAAGETSPATTTTFPNASLTGLPWTTTYAITTDSGPSANPTFLRGTVLPALVESPWAGHDKAYSFDGVNRGVESQRLDAGTTSVLTVQGTGAAAAFCLEAKVKVGALAALAHVVAGRWSGGGSPGTRQPLIFALRGGDGLYRFRGAVARADGTEINVDATSSLTGGGLYDVALTYDGTTLRIFHNGVLQGSAALTGVQAPNLAVRFMIGRDDDVDAATNGGFPWVGTVDEVRYSKVARYTANYTPATAPLTSDANTLGLWHLDNRIDRYTEDSEVVDPRVTVIPLFQLDDNVFGTPPLSKHEATMRRLTTQQGFIAARYMNARGEGLNGLTISRTLTPTKPGDAVVSTGAVTGTQGGEAGWTPLLPWASQLPGGRWVKTVDITGPAAIDADTHVIGNSVDHFLVAVDPNISVVGIVGGTSRGRHVSPGDLILIGAQLQDTAPGDTARMLYADTDAGGPLAFALIYRPNAAGTGADFLDTDMTWKPTIVNGVRVEVARHRIPVIPNTGDQFFRLVIPGTTTINWDASDIEVLVRIVREGAAYTSVLGREMTSKYNHHDKALIRNWPPA